MTVNKTTKSTNGSDLDSRGSKRDPLSELRELLREGLDDERTSSVNIHIDQVAAKKSLAPRAPANVKEAAIGTVVLTVLGWIGRKIWLLFHGP